MSDSRNMRYMSSYFVKLMVSGLAYFVWQVQFNPQGFGEWLFQQGVGIVVLFVMLYFVYREYQKSEDRSREQEEMNRDMLESAIETRKDFKEAIEDHSENIDELNNHLEDMIAKQERSNEYLKQMVYNGAEPQEDN